MKCPLASWLFRPGRDPAKDILRPGTWFVLWMGRATKVRHSTFPKRGSIYGSFSAVLVIGTWCNLAVMGQNAIEEVDKAVDRLVSIASDGGGGGPEVATGPAASSRGAGATVPAADPVVSSVDPAVAAREQRATLLLGTGEKRFWGQSNIESKTAMDVRFGREGKAWVYLRRLKPDGAALSDKEPARISWQWGGSGTEPTVLLEAPEFGRAEYRIQTRPGEEALVWLHSDPEWKAYQRLDLRTVVPGFYGSVFGEWNLN